MPASAPGPGGHILTGPVAIDGAGPVDRNKGVHVVLPKRLFMAK